LLKLALEKGSIKADIHDALRISTYEIMFIQKPAHVAVSQGVELVRSLQPYAAGFANKVLRNVVKLQKLFPFGDPEKDMQALAHKEAFPLWLAERLVADLGFKATALFMEASNLPAPLFLADLKTGAIVRDEPSCLPEYFSQIEAGDMVVADASAQKIASLAVPHSEQQTQMALQAQASLRLTLEAQEAQSQAQFDLPILEVGSGRGTKTVLMARTSERLHNKQPRIYALDLHPFKQQILEQRVRQYLLYDVRPVVGDVTKIDELVAAAKLPNTFAGSLIDAPCSGTATLRRNPEIRWRLTPDKVTDMAAQGLQMLKSVAPHIARGGFLIYSTCSVLKEENEQVVEAFLSGAEGTSFSMESDYFHTALTPGSADAHFAAKLVRLT
jgi:16S rRNA (cytosine967-C5)-methyltransferase